MTFTRSEDMVVRSRGGWRCLALLAIAAPPLACAGGRSPEVVATSSAALSRAAAASDDTFIGSDHPDNNSGASPSIYTGVNGQGGVMRGLIRFALPADLQGRATVTGVALT